MFTLSPQDCGEPRSESNTCRQRSKEDPQLSINYGACSSGYKDFTTCMQGTVPLEPWYTEPLWPRPWAVWGPGRSRGCSTWWGGGRSGSTGSLEITSKLVNIFNNWSTISGTWVTPWSAWPWRLMGWSSISLRLLSKHCKVRCYLSFHGRASGLVVMV